MSTSEDWVITADQLKQSLHTVTLLDVREPEEYQLSHIAYSKLIPLGELLARAQAELDKNADIIIYCAHGVRSMHALLELRQMGFTKLRSLVGGIAAWEASNGPTCRSA